MGKIFNSKSFGGKPQNLQQASVSGTKENFISHSYYFFVRFIDGIHWNCISWWICKFFVNVFVNFICPPPSNSFQIFQTGLVGLSGGIFIGRITNTKFTLYNRENKREISHLKKFFKTGLSVLSLREEGGGG